MILRQIRAQFPDQPVDKLMEEYIKAALSFEKINATPQPAFLGVSWSIWIRRSCPRGQCSLSRIKKVKVFQTELRTTNEAILIEETDFARHAQTLSTTSKVAHQYPLTEKQEKFMLFWEMSTEYALKYMTSFLLKFLKRSSPAKAQGHLCRQFIGHHSKWRWKVWVSCRIW